MNLILKTTLYPIATHEIEIVDGEDWKGKVIAKIDQLRSHIGNPVDGQIFLELTLSKKIITFMTVKDIQGEEDHD